MFSFFVIDVGNTSTKWAVSTPTKILKEYTFPTRNFTTPSFTHNFSQLPKTPKTAIISSVVPAATKGLQRALKQLGILRPLIVSSKMDLGITVRYPRPETIGADRLVNTVAAIGLYGAPAIVVDFGTAVTFDVISARNEYLGGVIAPGLASMTNYLHEQTALLPQITLKEPSSAIGKSTVSAMQIGAVVGYRGLVREILVAIQRDMRAHSKNRKSIQVIATGGHSRLISSEVPEIQFVAPRLTLDGLRLIYNRQSR